MKTNTYTLGEEIANSITHGIGVALSIAGLVILVVLGARYGDTWQVVSFSIYGSTLVLMYLASTLYHSLPQPKVKRIFKVIDHSAIYLLIAGTYTPFLLVTLRGIWGWSLFAVIWSLAILGIIFKCFFVFRFKKLSLTIYILMGWMALVALHKIIESIGWGGFTWLALGGVAYTLGVIFYVWKKLPYHHAIWHLFVLGGSICHFFAILRYIVAYTPAY
ncbi:MAG: hemolysin III family protein [Gemmatimonadetes bacterium]|nr:MAG: hemolysin III family protein [Gemmatimonadota bacterium]